MLDGSLSQSKMYFQLLQLLRIIPLWIRETRYDLEKLRHDCNSVVGRPIQGVSDQSLLRTASLVRQNWDEMMDRFRAHENELQKRIDAKTDELRGLRDGVRKHLSPS